MGLLCYLIIFWILSYIFHEFLSPRSWKLRRKIKHMCVHFQERLKMDSDILVAEHQEGMRKTIDEGGEILKRKESDTEKMQAFCQAAERRYEKVYPKSPMQRIKEFTEMVIVVGGVVMGVRALFLQPFKIPTGSMQPTLFGVHYEREDDLIVPGPVQRFFAVLNRGSEYVDQVIRQDGAIDDIRDATMRLGRFAVWEKTAVSIGGEWYELPCSRAALGKILSVHDRIRIFHRDEILARGQVYMGDHIMVDRVTYNFIEPSRGDVVVFQTTDIRYPDGQPLSGLHYIKRLVGMPGDTLRIENGKLFVKEQGQPNFVVVDGKFRKGFDRLYSGKGGYHGYTQPDGAYFSLARGNELVLKPNEYLVLGDNSRSSADSRYWGVVKRKDIVGRAALVWWPFSRRWGRVDHTEPADFPTPSDPNDPRNINKADHPE